MLGAILPQPAALQQVRLARPANGVCLVDGGVPRAPSIEGAFVLTIRGGDFELDIDQDISIGYSSHSSATVELYFLNSVTCPAC